MHIFGRFLRPLIFIIKVFKKQRITTEFATEFRGYVLTHLSEYRVYQIRSLFKLKNVLQYICVLEQISSMINQLFMY